MKSLDLMSVYELGSNISMTEEAKSAVKAAVKEQTSLNRIIKDMRSAAIYPHIAEVLRSVGIETSEELTIKNVKQLVAPELTKVVIKKVDGVEKEQAVICTIRKRYESVEVFITDEAGRKLCKVVGGKAVPRTQKVVKLDEDGEKVIKDYQLCEVHTWTIQGLLNVLAQSRVIREAK